MRELFQDKKGWLAVAVFIAALMILGTAKMLARNTNLTLILLVAISIVIVVILHRGENRNE